MAVNLEKYLELKGILEQQGVTLVAVSKMKPVKDILTLYEMGQRDFGENYVQELVDKQAQLPGDIRWHFIGHLQRNKVKYIAPFVHLIHGVDSEKLLNEISKQGLKLGRTLKVLLQVHIAQEETKFGLDEAELRSILQREESLPAVSVAGLMGMASFSDSQELVKAEFKTLKTLFDEYASLKPGFSILSMGMSGDYELAIEQGSNLVRIGSLLFGFRSSSQA